MSFKQLIIKIDAAHAELVSDLFLDLGALSTSVEDLHEGTELEQAIFNEPGMDVNRLWEHSKLTVLFNADVNVDELVSIVEQQLNLHLNITQEYLDDQDWVRLTQSQFNPIQITNNLYIVPSWHAIPDPQAIGIILDPGLAFGTGSHPTTFLCLHYLATHVKVTDSILDYGCGSGILAISAKKLGAAKVDGVDIDPQAIEASLNNAKINQVSVNFYLPNEFKTQQYDLVVANILANPLRILAAALASYVKTNGKIILSGILTSQIQEMSDIYSQWFTISVYDTLDGWACLTGVRY